MGDNPGIIITEQLIDAHRELMTQITRTPLDPTRVRNAARALRAAQTSAGWSESESEADAAEIISRLLIGDPRDPQPASPHELPQLIAAAVAEGFGLPVKIHVRDAQSNIH